DNRPRQQFGRVRTQPHGSAEVATAFQNRDLLCHRRDHRVRCLGRELAAVGSVETCHVARDLDHHALQAQTQSQDRYLAFTSVAYGADLALNAADPEPTWDDDAIDLAT